MEIKTDLTTKGTRILMGSEAKKKALIIRRCESSALSFGCERIILPILQFESTFEAKVGGENQKMMYTFQDMGGRQLCLAPEYTAMIQDLALNHFRYKKDVMVFYVQECFRAEKPQAGRYRQFTQFGVEILNPSKDYSKQLILLAQEMIDTPGIETNESVTRGLDYYVEGSGFEIAFPGLGAQKQICGGGAYKGGIGFALGIDRLLLMGK